MSKMNKDKIFEQLSYIDDELINESAAMMSMTVSESRRAYCREGRVYRFFHSAAWVAILSLAVSLSVVVGIVMIGRRAPMGNLDGGNKPVGGRPDNGNETTEEIETDEQHSDIYDEVLGDVYITYGVEPHMVLYHMIPTCFPEWEAYPMEEVETNMDWQEIGKGFTGNDKDLAAMGSPVPYAIDGYELYLAKGVYLYQIRLFDENMQEVAYTKHEAIPIDGGHLNVALTAGIYYVVMNIQYRESIPYWVSDYVFAVEVIDTVEKNGLKLSVVGEDTETEGGDIEPPLNDHDVYVMSGAQGVAPEAFLVSSEQTYGGEETARDEEVCGEGFTNGAQLTHPTPLIYHGGVTLYLAEGYNVKQVTVYAPDMEEKTKWKDISVLENLAMGEYYVALTVTHPISHGTQTDDYVFVLVVEEKGEEETKPTEPEPVWEGFVYASSGGAYVKPHLGCRWQEMYDAQGGIITISTDDESVLTSLQKGYGHERELPTLTCVDGRIKLHVMDENGIRVSVISCKVYDEQGNEQTALSAGTYYVIMDVVSWHNGLKGGGEKAFRLVVTEPVNALSIEETFIHPEKIP